ncbi:Steroid 21-hydroxylase [Nymphaea thermarum]|nr:Steroid 21-hydroxylase [Nymphaea thermarum]
MKRNGVGAPILYAMVDDNCWKRHYYSGNDRSHSLAATSSQCSEENPGGAGSPYRRPSRKPLRLGPPMPLLTLRESIEDCLVSGFCVPAGTRLMVNLWKIHLDLRVWNDPNKFQPERFLGSNVDVHGKQFHFLPFGLGQRICPGISFALRIVHIALARLLQGFDMKLLPADSSFDYDTSLGRDTISNVLLAPRLPQALYG